ncbi:hypothetical protein SLH46_20805 [Draconibacterium sp. IB214405]|uniref:condensin complex protein MksE n=1 Tax=Draconibacterium sp. IB214405 TaxID=3097352 RepID=UPI002A0EB600|nr:hypothetical protein [Draconibacterium sp. IB214405]MDX8341651.1 hypothetical protein [Draconibacterium sp. IB214405]
MENENKKEVTRLDFLTDKKADQVFAKIDYMLRSGVHIQSDYPLPGELFRFIGRNYDSLKLYYDEIYKVVLNKSGSEFNTYYFIDFEEGSRGNILGDHREYLKTEHIIIGMLFFKLFKLDGNIELDRVSDFTNLLFSEYEEEREALQKLIADAMNDKSSDLNEDKIGGVIKKAFEKFNELGWIAWDDEQDKDRFRYMPSFERLRLLYQPQILGIDELLKNLKNDR